MLDKYKTLFVISGLTIVALAVFWQVRGFEFVNYDDADYVSDNAHILSGLTFKNVTWVFIGTYGGHWHPLTGLSHMLDCQLFGPNPGRHHLTSLLLHIFNTLLFFLIFKKITNALWQSAFVAALFAIHPLHVESVAWLSDRKDVLSTFFWILTIGAYFRYAKSHLFRWYAVALVLFALGLMAKPMLVTLPFALLLLDYWPLERLEGKTLFNLLLEKIPFFILAAISSVVTFLVFRHIGIVTNIQNLPLSMRIGNAAVSYCKYIGKLFRPSDLAAFYPYSGKQSAIAVFASIVSLLLITILVIRLASKFKYLPVGWFWYLGTLIPVIGLVQVGDQSMADRYTYIPLIGLFIIIAWGAGDLLANWKYHKTILGLSSLAIISVLAVCSNIQTGYWHDSMSLFNHAIKVTKGNYIAYNGRGFAWYDRGRYDYAISDYSKAVEACPNFIEAYYNRGNACAKGKGDCKRAILDYNKAVELNPKYARAYNNRGSCFYSQGAYDLAIADYNRAIAANPDYAEAYSNRGKVYKDKGRIDLAFADFNKAIDINPLLADAYYNQGMAFYSQGKFDLAVADYTKVIEINPWDNEAYNNRGAAYYSKGAFDLAIADYNKAIQIKPGYPLTYFNKACACENAGRKGEAIEAYKIFIRYAPASYASFVERAKQKISQLERQAN